MVTETWPPRTAEEMLALQARYGSDFDIAAAVNLTRNAVSQARKNLASRHTNRQLFGQRQTSNC